MNWTDLEALWSRHMPMPSLAAPLSVRLQTIATEQAKISRILFWRDVKGGVIGLGIAAFLAYKVAPRGRELWPAWIAVALIAGVSLVLLAERLRARRHQPRPEAPLLDRVTGELAELRRHRWMLRNVGLWYVSPLFLAAGIFWATAFRGKPGPWHDHGTVFWCAYGTLWIAAGWITRTINRRYSRRIVEPQIAAMEQVLAEYQSTSPKAFG
jgi:hypothetical protein